MAITATVTDILTEGFAEVAVWENGEPGKARSIAEFEKKLKAKRGDIVELKTAAPQDMKVARTAYLLVLVLAAFGMLLSKGAWNERLLNAAILGFLGFIVAWLMNRRARLLRRREYRISRIVQKKSDL